jgi:hypothetical protein
MTENPLELAKQIGYAHFDEIGSKAFEELELAFASLFAPRFKERSEIRAWQNLNFYWTKCYFKNSIMDVFTRCLPDAFNHRKITSASPEIMFGSMREDHTDIIKPMFYDFKLAFIPELLSFLGQGDTLRIKTDILNEVVEGQKVTRYLVKFGEASAELRAKYSNPDGLFLTSTSLQYTPKTCFVIATRPLERKIFTYLNGSGFLSRFHTVQIRIPDEMVSRISTGSAWQNDIGEGSETSRKMYSLKLFNTEFMKYWEAHLDLIHLPDYTNVWLPITQEADKMAKGYAEKLDIPLRDIWNPRVTNEILREVNAFRMLYPETSDEQALRWCDTKRLRHFFDFIINPDIAQEVIVSTQNRVDLCYEAINATFKGRKGVARAEILTAMEGQGFRRPTIDRAKERLKKSEYGHYDFD